MLYILQNPLVLALDWSKVSKEDALWETVGEYLEIQIMPVHKKNCTIVMVWPSES